MKKRTVLALLTLLTLQMRAQETKTTWVNNVKLSGYGIVQYQYVGTDGAKSNSFNLRLGRVSLEGRILNDFYWKAQIQFNGNTSTLGSSPRLVDLFAEWQKYGAFRVKVGQFKLPFTFENPMHPLDQGFMSYSQNVTKLAGFSDRSGKHPSNGRDIGVQLQGDFLKNSGGRNLLHYQVGVFNGQGINVKDVDQRKTVAGGVWVMPVKGMRIGVFGMEDSYARKGTWTDEQTGAARSGVRSLSQHRFAVSADYKTVSDYTFRTEYIHSTGSAFRKALTKTDGAEAKDCTLSADGDKADGYYALAIVPIIKKQWHVKARYDLYRPTGDWAKAKTFYEVGMDYEFGKNFMISGEYALVNDRSLVKSNYSILDVQVSFRF
ncbi:porin [Hoylesella enoeca]|uniref:porin n=1 Tax=Hoylesella enoeca TaxID=76123 RepID=UPI00288AA2AA|nr:porin [Hoylesella enoeca]